MKKVNQQKDVYSEIGSRLRMLREEKGFSLDQISARMKKTYQIELSANMIGKIERGETRIQTDVFLIFCRFYKIDFTWFFPEIEINYMPEKYNILINQQEGRDCLTSIGRYAEKNEILAIISEFINGVIPKVEHILNKKHKESVLLKASSPGKKNNP